MKTITIRLATKHLKPYEYYATVKNISMEVLLQSEAYGQALALNDNVFWGLDKMDSFRCVDDFRRIDLSFASETHALLARIASLVRKELEVLLEGLLAFGAETLAYHIADALNSSDDSQASEYLDSFARDAAVFDIRARQDLPPIEKNGLSCWDVFSISRPRPTPENKIELAAEYCGSVSYSGDTVPAKCYPSYGQFVVKPVSDELMNVVTLDSDLAVCEFWRKQIEPLPFYSPHLEHCVVFVLNTDLTLKGWSVVAIGPSTGQIVSGPDILRAVLVAGGNRFILAHNHTGKNAEPSQSDKDTTKTLLAAAAQVGLQMCDHVIVSSINSFSFAGAGLLSSSKLSSSSFKERSERQSSIPIFDIDLKNDIGTELESSGKKRRPRMKKDRPIA